MSVGMRYDAEYRPEENGAFPWMVRDSLDHDVVGPCFSARDAAVVAWALDHRKELMGQHSDLRDLVDECVSRSVDSDR